MFLTSTGELQPSEEIAVVVGLRIYHRLGSPFRTAYATNIFPNASNPSITFRKPTRSITGNTGLNFIQDQAYENTGVRTSHIIGPPYDSSTAKH